jgi:hypothetical protein
MTTSVVESYIDEEEEEVDIKSIGSVKGDSYNTASTERGEGGSSEPPQVILGLGGAPFGRLKNNFLIR